ncbi:MAG: desulfoferrodoxin [Elusimicrobia bacterium]|nr:desulfoferrodoxin [Elusimicrobiota bacterium]
MSKRFQIYKCESCGGDIVEVLHAGDGNLTCCGKEMKALEEKANEQGTEKHLPVTEKTDGGIKVKVGSIPHPMEEKHYIQWIEVITTDGIAIKFLKPGVAPEAEFKIDGDILQVREYCNVHGLWVKK